MQHLTEWLERIVATVILAGFLEMILPHNDLRGVARMVMGLLVILVLAQPLLKVFRLPTELALGIPEGTLKRSWSTAQVIAAGQRIRERVSADFQNEQRVHYEERMRWILGLTAEMELRKLTVQWDGMQIVKLTVEAKAVGFDPHNQTEVAKLTAKIKNSIQLVANINPTQIEVIWHG